MPFEMFKLRLNEALPVWDLFISVGLHWNERRKDSQPHSRVYESIKNGEGKQTL